MNFSFFLIFTSLFCIRMSEDLLSKFSQNDYRMKDFLVESKYYNERFVRKFNVVTFKYNRTIAAYNFTFNLKMDIKDKLELATQVYKFASNQYHLFPIRFQVNVCKAYAANFAGMKQIGTCGNINDTCHFLKDIDYQICNFIADDSKFPPFLPNGRYMATANFTYLDQLLAIGHGYAEVYRPLVVKY